MNKNLLASILMALTVTASVAQTPTKDALVARAKSFELDTPYVPAPGDPLTHHAAGYAKVMCSAVFLTGLAPDFAADVRSGQFPADDESYHLAGDVAETLGLYGGGSKTA